MRPPVDILAEVKEMKNAGEGAGASAQHAAAFCERDHSIPFHLTEGTTVSVGDGVHLGAEDPPTVLGRDGLVGAVAEPQAKAMRACVAMGYRMQGEVTAVDNEAGTGTLRIAGEVAKAA